MKFFYSCFIYQPNVSKYLFKNIYIKYKKNKYRKNYVILIKTYSENKKKNLNLYANILKQNTRRNIRKIIEKNLLYIKKKDKKKEDK